MIAVRMTKAQRLVGQLPVGAEVVVPVVVAGTRRLLVCVVGKAVRGEVGELNRTGRAGLGPMKVPALDVRPLPRLATGSATPPARPN